jgi:hypothetical protein
MVIASCVMCRSDKDLVYNAQCMHVFCRRHINVLMHERRDCVVCKAVVSVPHEVSPAPSTAEVEVLFLGMRFDELFDNIELRTKFGLTMAEAAAARESADLRSLHAKATEMQTWYQNKVRELNAQVKTLKMKR